MSFNAEQRRFNWIHAYNEAMRLALVNELAGGQAGSIITFQQLAGAECSWWQGALTSDEELRRWLAHKRGRGCYWSVLLAHDFYYLYDLEAELWGANPAQFLDCTQVDQQVGLEPFRLVLLFYLVERALKLLLAHFGFLNYEQGNHSHARIRDAAYHHLFQPPHLARWLPFPFSLTALSRRLVHGQADYLRHAAYHFDPYHFSAVSKPHYTGVLESALCQAVAGSASATPARATCRLGAACKPFSSTRFGTIPRVTATVCPWPAIPCAKIPSTGASICAGLARPCWDSWSCGSIPSAPGTCAKPGKLTSDSPARLPSRLSNSPAGGPFAAARRSFWLNESWLT